MQPTTKRLVTEASVAGHVVGNLPARLGEAALSATYGPKESVYVASHLTAGATAAQNVTAINAAITAAVAANMDVCFDGVTCSIDAEFTITTAGLRLWSSTPDSCQITQTAAAAGKGVFRVNADNVTIDGFTVTGNIPLTGGGLLELTGMTVDAHEVSAIKVQPGIDGLTVRRIRGYNWFIVLTGFPYPIGTEYSALATSYDFITKLTVDDIEVDRVWAAVRMSGLDGADFRNVRGRYIAAAGPAQVSTAPPHVFYISMPNDGVDAPRAYNRNIRIANCHAQDSVGGAPFSLRYTKGMTWSNLTADKCEGLVDMVGVTGFHGTGAHSTRDIYPKDNLWNGNRGSMSMLYCRDGVLDPFVVESADDFQHGSVIYVGVCENVSVLEPRGWIDLPAIDGGLRAAYFSGRNVRVTRPVVESRGEAVAIGIQLASGFNGTDSTVILDNPETKGAFMRGVEVLSTTTKQTVIYDPDRLEGSQQDISVATAVTLAGSPNLVNTRYGHPPAQDARVIGWFHGEKLGEGSVLRTRWPSGHVSNIHTDAWVGAAPYMSANATVTGLMCADFGVVDVDLACQVKWASGSVGLAFRAIDTNNFLQVVLTSTSVILAKRVAGVYTTLVSAALDVPTAGIWHDIRVRVIGTKVIVRVDGAQAISHTLAGGDETTFATATSHGLRSDNGGAGSGWYGLQVRKVS